MADTTKAQDQFGAEAKEVSQPLKRQTQRQAILVAGMHRSGTSTVTRVLSLLGCALPKTMVAASKGDNDRGFWESTAVVGLNNEILHSAGSKWDDWNFIEADWFESGIAQQFIERAADVIDKEYESAPLIAIKDPRICRFLSIWIKAVELADYHANIVVPIRHPLEVAESLFNRSLIDTSVGQLMWLRHTLDAERFSRDQSRSFISFDSVMNDWRKPFDQVSEQLNVIFPRVSAAASDDIFEFLSPDLWRNRAANLSASRRIHTSNWVDDSYSIFKRWANNEASSEDFTKLDEISAKLSETTPVFLQALSSSRNMRTEARDLLNDKSKLESSIEKQSELLSKRELQIEQLNASICTLEDSLRSAKSDSLSLNQKLDQAEMELRAAQDRSEEAARLWEMLDEAQKHLLALQKSHSREEVRRQETEKAAASLKTELRAAQDQLAEMHTKIEGHNDEAQKHLLALQKSHSREEVRRQETEKAAASLKTELRAAQDQLAEMHTKIEGHNAAFVENERERFKETAKLTHLLIETQARLDATQKSLSSETELRKAADKLNDGLKTQARATKDNVEDYQAKFEILEGALQRSEESRFGETARLTALLRDQQEKAKKLRKATLDLLKPKAPSPMAKRLRLNLLSIRFRKREILRQREILLSSGIFDQDWYLAQNQDVALSGMDPLQHYLTYGALEGRAPSLTFS